jgi:glycosyltransferase involved in cell wall biosynthesis
VKILLAVASLRPEQGGPAYSVSGLARALASDGVEVGLWAADQSATTSPLLSGLTSVRPLAGTARESLEAFGRPDVIHDNGIWLFHNHALARLARDQGIPRVVSTRGMLEPWALRHKAAKKRLAWWAYQRLDMRSARFHHATSDCEATHLRELNLGVPIAHVSNGVDLPADGAIVRAVPGGVGQVGPRTALFLGRIYPVKGLPMLVEAWARVRPCGWVLRIAGPDEAGHRTEVEQAVAAAGLRDEVFFTGPADRVAKRSAFFNADIFVLPTHSESFGMAVAEALAHGLPVLTTTGAPWRCLVDAGCGWWVEPTTDGITAGLREATSLDGAVLRRMGTIGRSVVEERFQWSRVSRAMIDVYEDSKRTGSAVTTRMGASQLYVPGSATAEADALTNRPK